MLCPTGDDVQAELGAGPWKPRAAQAEDAEHSPTQMVL